MVFWKIKKPSSLQKDTDVMSLAATSDMSFSSVCMLYESSGRDVSGYYTLPMILDPHNKPKAGVYCDISTDRTTLTQQWYVYALSDRCI